MMMRSSGIKNVIIKLCMAFINVMALSFFVMLFTQTNTNFFTLLAVTLILNTTLILLVVLKDTSTVFYKLVSTINVVFLLVAMLIILFKNVGLFDKLNSAEAIKNLILSSGKWGIVVFFVITLLQVVVLPIPASVTVLLGALIYGSTVSFLVSVLATIVGSLICYLLGYFFGFKLVAWLIGKNKTKKAMSYLDKKARIPFVLMLLFPFFPDDILCMVAGLTRMSFKFYLITILLCRPVSLAFISYFGTGNLIPFSGWGIPVWLGIAAVMLFSCYILSNVIKKKKLKDNKKHI